MNEWVREKREFLYKVYFLYGKLILILLLIASCFISLTILIYLILPKKLSVSFLDIGQGDAVLVQTPGGHDMLIDGGASDVILEKLSSKMRYFDRHLDVVVATHPDADHVTGLIPVLAKYGVSHIVISPVAGHTGVSGELEKSIENEHASVHTGTKGDEIIFGDGVTAHILYPSSDYHGNKSDTNDASVSMVITYGDEAVLLTGDLPSTHEGELISSTLPRHVTIYKAGHHGSKYSSGEQLLSYIRPEYVVISAGKNNRYGHPNPEAIDRLTTYSQEILSTIEKGTITFLLDGRTVKVETVK